MSAVAFLDTELHKCQSDPASVNSKYENAAAYATQRRGIEPDRRLMHMPPAARDPKERTGG